MIVSLEKVPKIVSEIFNLQDGEENQRLFENYKVDEMLLDGLEVRMLCYIYLFI